MVSRKRYIIVALVAFLCVYFYVFKHKRQVFRQIILEDHEIRVGNEDSGIRIRNQDPEMRIRNQNPEMRNMFQTSGINQNSTNGEKMVVVVVVCEDRWQETLVQLKSTLLFTKGYLQFYIFAESKLMRMFWRKLKAWKKESNKSFDFSVLQVKFPAGELESSWKKLFKPCAALRLFLPSLLPDVDSVLYLDTDTIVLGSVEQIWHHFSLMNSSQLAALAPEHEEPHTAWYNRFARHPFYKPLGVNTGVMLMNLTRMRKFEWEKYLPPIYKEYKLKIPWGDQDIINIIFHYHPDKLYIYSCRYNYRADHCMYSSVCKVAEKEGIVVLHGSRGIFHNDKFPPFKSVYRAMENYNWGGDPYVDFYLKLELYLKNSSSASNCGKVLDAFTRNVRQFIKVDKPA